MEVLIIILLKITPLSVAIAQATTLKNKFRSQKFETIYSF
jgi:hypothetical protein